MISEDLKRYIEAQKKKINKYKAVWRAKNKEKITKYNREYHQKRRAKKKGK